MPQLFFVTLLFSILVGYFSVRAIFSPEFGFYLAIVSISSVAVLWFETLRLWRKLVTWK
ncbi:MAG: hypothetical protein ACREBQ_06850 [Nitrososphaerales archaeon]